MKKKAPVCPPTPAEFRQADQTLARLDPAAVASLLCTAADITLVLDTDGVIQDIAYGDEALAAELGAAWVGKIWLDTVGEDSRGKVAALLAPPKPGAMRWRQINQTLPDGGAVVMSYASHALPAQDGAPARWFVFGRDQRVTTALQQRLVEAQLSVERDYARFRQPAPARMRGRHRCTVSVGQQNGQAVGHHDRASQPGLSGNAGVGYRAVGR